MHASRRGRLGAALLILGGLLEAGAFTVGTVVSLPGSTLPGASLVLGYAVGSVCVGTGLIATGIALRGGGRTALVIAGVLALIMPVVNAAQSLTGAPLGPAPSQLTSFTFVVALVIAAVLVLSDSRQRSAVRWSIAVPATCFVIAGVTTYLPLPAVPGIIVLPWGGMAAAGVLLLRSWNRRSRAAARPVPS